MRGTGHAPVERVSLALERVEPHVIIVDQLAQARRALAVTARRSGHSRCSRRLLADRGSRGGAAWRS